MAYQVISLTMAVIAATVIGGQNQQDAQQQSGSCACPCNSGFLTVPPGPPGPPGFPGVQGPQGLTGPSGNHGIPGVQGQIGSQGLKGDIGQGSKGQSGEPGSIGEPGMDGIAGPRGIPGKVGPQGQHGVKGDKGLTGPSGNHGIPGVQGQIGSQGLKGDIGQGSKGQSGEPGSIGEPGMDGIAGPRGISGKVGPQGIRGIQGPTGNEGQHGVKGEKGEAGTSYTVPPMSAFSARLINTLHVSSGSQIITYQYEDIDEADDFNPSSGIFNCSIQGLYYFSFTFLPQYRYNFDVRLERNGSMKARIYYTKGSHLMMQSHSVILSLQVGDEVALKATATTRITNSSNFNNIFNGYLIHAT